MRMYNTKKMISYIIMLVLGVALVVAACFEVVNEFLSGFGGGIAGVAAVRLVLGMKYMHNPEYAKKVDISNSDERTRYISGLAKSWAFVLSILGLAICGFVLIALGYSNYGQICMYILCSMALIYWVAYIILSKKN